MQRVGKPCMGTREVSGVVETMRWPSQRDAADYLGVTPGSLSQALDRGGTCGGWWVRPADTTRPERPPAMGGIVVQRYGDAPVRCFSMLEAAQRMGSDARTVRKAIKSGTLVAGFWAWGAA